MKRLLNLFLALAVILFCQCRSGESDDAPAYNEFVSAYTNGSVPRKSEVRVLFSQDIPQGRLDSLPASEVMQLSPKVEGSCRFVNSRTLAFTPSVEMGYAEHYTVKVAVDKLFEGAAPFKFSFQTRPFAIGGSLKSFDVTDDDQYELTFNLQTADSETPKAVESHVSLSMACEPKWTHATGGTNHQLKVRVKPTSQMQLTLTQNADKAIGAEGKEITSVQLPSTESLAVFGARGKEGDRKCVEITFNKKLDSKQDVKGLVYIDQVKTQAVVEGNKVMLYANLDEEENISVNVSNKLRSQKGQTMQQSATYSISLATQKPEVQFIGDGTIVPQSDRVLVPFRSIYMRGVRVTVFKMFANMIGSILQRADIDETSNLIYAARPIAATTFYIDDPSLDLSQWHTFAIDLTDQVKLEPGAMYRIELSLDARLSAWPSDSLPQATRQEMEIEDSRIMNDYARRFDEGSYYYTGAAYEESLWWYDGYYERRNDPSSRFYYNDRTIGRNVLATNIGLSALRGSANVIAVTAINLPDALPMSGVTIEAYNMQQQLVGTAKSNDQGIAEVTFEPKMGQPTYLVARKGDDVSYLKVTNDQSLSTSTFDVDGNVIERGLKGFIYGERGVWRPGDTLHIAFMLNDRNKTLPADHPVTLRISNPLGQETHRITRTTSAMGVYAFTIPTAEDAPNGVWSAQVNVGGVTFQKNLRIESIKPNRLKIDLTLPKGTLTSGSNKADLHTEWLNGNAASGLKYDISATIIETKTSWKGYAGYVFDDPTKSFETSEQDIAKGEVSATGSASCLLNLNTGKTAPGMLLGSLVTHVYEPSGEFSVDVTQALIAPYSRFVGIKPAEQRDQSHLDTDRDHTFSLASVDKDGNAVPDVKLKVDIYKVDWYWWWSSSRSDMAGYTSSSYNKPVKSLTVMTDAKGKGDFTLNMTEANWGTYLIVAQDVASGHSAGTLSYFDWPWMTSRRNTEAGENATVLTLATDKKEYAPGEKIRVSFPSESGSRAIVSISNGSRVLHLGTYACKKERTEVLLDATDEMTPNIYIGVSLVQPYNQTFNDMPIRLYGLTPVTVTSAKSHLHPVVNCADEFRPESKVQVTVSEKEGRPMGYTLAIVDEGLLDLTHFKTPDAWNLFNAREALGTRFWDLYSHVNGAYGGRIEQLFSIGGDEALLNSPKAIVNRFTPMVHFVGPFTLKKGEKRTHKVNVPNYNGRVRVMVVAGDGNAYGSTDKSVLVRRPLMLIGTMPRQIGRGDEMTVSATVFATQQLGEVSVSVSAGAGLQVVGEKTRTVRFDEAGDKTLQFLIKDQGQQGLGTVTLTATAGSNKADYTSHITIRTVSQPVRQTRMQRVEPGATYDQNLTIPGDGDYKLLMGVSANQPLNLLGRLSQLIAYPHGCAEQTTSKAFPQLYLSEFSELTAEQQTEIEDNIKNCIDRLASYQTSNGGMSYWPGGRQSHPWASAYILHFFTEAIQRGYYVPEDMSRRLKQYVIKQANAWTIKDEAATAAYQLYVLAAMQSSEIGAMNRMREHVADLPLSAIQLLSASYALSGRKEVGNDLLKNTGNQKHDYGWFSTDVSRLLAQMTLDDKRAPETAEEIRKSLLDDRWLSTSECAMSLVAMSQYYKKHTVGKGLKFSLSLDGKTLADVKSERFSWDREQALKAKQAHLTVRNISDAVMYVTVTAEGVATQSKVQRMADGLEVSAQYTTDSNSPLDATSLSQSTTFRCALTVRNTSGKDLENVAVTHIVPAGWEILSATPAGTIHYQDQRDDRLLSYIDYLRNGESVTIRLNLSATYAGEYYLPSVRAEAMYDATISGCTESATCVVK